MPGGAPEPYDVTPYAQVPQRAAATAVPDAGSAPQEVDHRRETVPLATLDSTATSPDSRSAPLLDDTRALRASSQAPQASAVLHASSEAPTADAAAQPQAPAGSISSARLLDAHDAADAGSSVAAASSAASPTERDARAEDALDVRDAPAAAHETDRDARLGAAATPEADLPPVETTVADKPVATAELAAADVAANEPTARPRSATPSFARRRGRLTTLRAWPLYVASVVLALVLALQLLLAQRAELAADAGSRPLVLNVCGVLRCSVPAWHEPSAFNMLQRNVLPRRGAPGQLAVDARFRNDARWPQAWPTLVLTLADVDGRPIAARAFKPADYLPARHAPLIDAGQSAQVQLNVLEPGPGVVAFTFEFR